MLCFFFFFSLFLVTLCIVLIYNCQTRFWTALLYLPYFSGIETSERGWTSHNALRILPWRLFSGGLIIPSFVTPRCLSTRELMKATPLVGYCASAIVSSWLGLSEMQNCCKRANNPLLADPVYLKHGRVCQCHINTINKYPVDLTGHRIFISSGYSV